MKTYQLYFNIDPKHIKQVRPEHRVLVHTELLVARKRNPRETGKMLMDSMLEQQLRRPPNACDYANIKRVRSPLFKYGWYLVCYDRLFGTMWYDDIATPKKPGISWHFVPYEMLTDEDVLKIKMDPYA